VITSHDGVRIQIKADIGFINEQPPQRFNDKLIYVCLLVDTSDGRKIHFARIRYVFHDVGIVIY
jgi:ATP-dependent DNA helicase HFM1/MER3